MNHIEDGIFEAHEMIAAEEQQRKTSDNNLQTALADEAANRAAAINNEAQARQQAVSDINEKIPNQASATNQLADKDFVNSSINNAAAFLITPTAEGVHHWPSFAALQAGPWFSGGNPRAPSQNDYAFFTNIDLEIGETGSEWRALFSAGIWTPGIKINNTPFTAAQLAAINSGITQMLVNKIANPDNVPERGSGGFVKSGGIFAWFGDAVTALQTTAKTVVQAINELFNNKLDAVLKGAADGVAELDGDGRVPVTQIPNVPVSINRTVTVNDNAVGAVTDTGDNLNIPLPVTVAAPVASSAQTTAGTRPSRAQLKILIDNIAHLFANKANDSDVVKLTGDQTVAGIKTFSTSPVVPSKNAAIAASTAANTATAQRTAAATEAQVAVTRNDLQINIDAKAGFYAGSAQNNTDFPLGATVLVWGAFNRNQAYPVYLGSDARQYTETGTTALGGTWRASGSTFPSNGYTTLFRKTAV